MQLGILEPPDFEWEKPIVAGEDDELVAVINVRAQRHFRRVLGSGLHSGRRGLGPRRSNSLMTDNSLWDNYARPEGRFASHITRCAPFPKRCDSRTEAVITQNF